MPPRVLIFQHAADCHPGMFTGFLKADAIDPVTVELDRGVPIPAVSRPR